MYVKTNVVILSISCITCYYSRDNIITNSFYLNLNIANPSYACSRQEISAGRIVSVVNIKSRYCKHKVKMEKYSSYA
jgi:hypothetical protein